MAEYDFQQDDEQRRVSAPSYQSPTMPRTLPSSPFPSNTPIGNTGHSSPNTGFDLTGYYQQMFGRNPDQNEQASDTENIAKYGVEAFQQDFQKRLGPQGPASAPRPPSAFSDPLGGPVNDYANERFQRLSNPPAGSGQAMLEDALRRISQQFRDGGYTPGEMEQFQTQAIDPLERLRTARRQQVMESLSRRGITTTSGVASAMLADVDRQFDALRSQQQTQIGTQAANERRARMLQSLEMLSGLASTEEGRMDRAFNYRTVPLQLGDRAFTQAMQLYSQANPMNLFNPAMQMASIGQQQQGGQQNALANLAWLLLNGGR